jgi:DNA-binding CsgD family transcriptional regulator
MDRRIFPLTDLQLQILGDYANGMTTEEIAKERFYTSGTVLSMIHRVRVKLGATTTANAVARALTLGIIREPQIENADYWRAKNMPTSTKVTGHSLVGDGAAFRYYGNRWERVKQSGIGGKGKGLCSCGEASPNLDSGGKRRLWHDEHKQTVRRERTSVTEAEPMHDDHTGQVGYITVKLPIVRFNVSEYDYRVIADSGDVNIELHLPGQYSKELDLSTAPYALGILATLTNWKAGRR